MENPYDYNRLVTLFEEKNYLLSKEISELWLKFLKDKVLWNQEEAVLCLLWRSPQ